MIICAAGDIHGAIDRLYQEVLAFEEPLGVRFAWVSSTSVIRHLAGPNPHRRDNHAA